MKLTNKSARLLLLVVMLLFVGRIASTYRVFSETSDESFHIGAGLEYLQFGRYTFEPQHPPLGRVVVAALPYFFADLRLTSPDDQHWSSHVAVVWDTSGLDYYWKTLTLARAANLPFAVLLLLFVYQWSLRLYGQRAALTACLIVACCPSLIAHAGLATLDIGPTATTLMAAYFFWRWSHEPSWRYCLLSGGSLALAWTSKFSTIAFLPPIMVLYFVAVRWRRWRNAGLLRRENVLLGFQRAAAFTAVLVSLIWTVYLFDIGPVSLPDHLMPSKVEMDEAWSPPHVGLARLIDSKVLPARPFWLGLIELLRHNHLGHPAYLLGEFSSHGWWYYFPVALAVKSTLPMLALFVIGVVIAFRKNVNGPVHPAIFGIIPVILVLGVSMMANINIGVRHILPLYPFLAIVGSAVFACEDRSGGRVRPALVLALVLLVWHVGESIRAHPDYLPYFNQIARGREEKFLIDSNLDWGQDMARLGRYMKEKDIASVKLTYPVNARTKMVGVNTEPLPPDHPDAGWIAVGANALVGLDQPGFFKPLRETEPWARVGKSIWLYRVDPQDKVIKRFLAYPRKEPKDPVAARYRRVFLRVLKRRKPEVLRALRKQVPLYKDLQLQIKRSSTREGATSLWKQYSDKYGEQVIFSMTRNELQYATIKSARGHFYPDLIPLQQALLSWARSSTLPQVDGFLVDWMGEVALRTLAVWSSRPKSKLNWYFPPGWVKEGASPAERRVFRTQANWLIQRHFDDRSYRDIGEASKPQLREEQIRRAVSRVAELIEFPIGGSSRGGQLRQMP